MCVSKMATRSVGKEMVISYFLFLNVVKELDFIMKVTGVCDW